MQEKRRQPTATMIIIIIAGSSSRSNNNDNSGKRALSSRYYSKKSPAPAPNVGWGPLVGRARAPSSPSTRQPICGRERARLKIDWYYVLQHKLVCSPVSPTKPLDTSCFSSCFELNALFNSRAHNSTEVPVGGTLNGYGEPAWEVPLPCLTTGSGPRLSMATPTRPVLF